MLSWLVASVFYMYELILRFCTGVMTHELMESFGVGATSLGWFNSLYYYAYVPLQIPCGLLVDRFGAKRVISVSSAVCTIGILLLSTTSVLFVAKISRFLIGAGSACAFISCLKISIDSFDPSKFALMAGLTNALGTIGGCFAGPPLSYLVSIYGWRGTTMILGIIGIVVTTACICCIKNNKVHNVSYNLWRELYVLLQNSKIIICGFVGCLMYLPMSVLCELWMTPFLKNVFSIHNHTAAYGGTMICIGMAVGGLIYPKFINERRSTDHIILYGSLLSTILFSTIPFFNYTTLSYAFGLLFLSGVVMGAQVLCFNWAKEKTPVYFSGTAIALTNAIVMIGGIIFQPLMGHILDFTWTGGINTEGVRIYTVQSYQYAMASIPLCFLISSLVVFMNKKKDPL